MSDAKGKLVTIYAENPSNEVRGLELDADDHLKVAIGAVALPTGASTEAKQDTAITALQLIDDLRNALGSVDTDDLQVDVKTAPTTVVIPHADEKILGYELNVVDKVTVEATGSATTVTSTPVPSGKVWKITHITTWNSTTTINVRLTFAHNVDDSDIVFRKLVPSFAAGITYDFPCELYLKATDYITVIQQTTVSGDDCHLILQGYQMNAP